MHPVNSVEAIVDASNNTIGYRTASQSGNIFKNTHHNMSKKKCSHIFLRTVFIIIDN